MATKSPGGTIELLIRRADNLYDVGSFGDRKIDPFVKCIPMWNDKCSKEKKDQWKATNYVDDAGVNPVVRCDTDTCQLLLIVVFSYYITTINSSLILADIYFCILFSLITFLQKNLFGRYPIHSTTNIHTKTYLHSSTKSNTKQNYLLQFPKNYPNLLLSTSKCMTTTLLLVLISSVALKLI